MCLIIDRPAGVPIPNDLISRAMSQNSHGWGIMRAEDGELSTVKGFGEKAFRKAYKAIGDAPCVIHYRLATHGDKTAANVHPFTLCRGQYALVHNGIIDTAPDFDATRSDTWHFAHYVVEPMLLDDPSRFGDPRFSNVLERLAGDYNKLVLLRADGAKMTVNAAAGLEYEGLWLSNAWSLARAKTLPTIAATPIRSYSPRTGWSSRWDDEETTDFIPDRIDDDERYDAYLASQIRGSFDRDAFYDQATSLEDFAGLTEEEIMEVVCDDPSWVAAAIREYLERRL